MAPIKFEDNIREKLQERELSPSKEAWNKLSTRLQDQSVQRSRKPFWYAIAASFVGILIVTSLLWKENTLTGSDTDLVENQTEETLIENENTNIPVKNNSVELAVEDTNYENTNEKESLESISNNQQIVSQNIQKGEAVSENVRATSDENVIDRSGISSSKEAVAAEDVQHQEINKTLLKLKPKY